MGPQPGTLGWWKHKSTNNTMFFFLWPPLFISYTHMHARTQNKKYTFSLTPCHTHIDYLICTDIESHKQLFTWTEVNRAADSRLVLCVSFVRCPLCRRLWPLASSNFCHHIQIRRPAVSLIRVNVLNHLSCGCAAARTRSLLNHQHLDLALVIAAAGGNTLRDWGSQPRQDESTFPHLH